MPIAPPRVCGTVPRAWPESTIVCLGGGPSLRAADVDACRDRARVIAINDAYQLAPWADVLYACDAKFWRWHDGVRGFTGQKYALQNPDDRRFPADAGIVLLRNTGTHGLERQPDGLRTGHNSGYQAINLAVHFGARRIVLLGYDMQGDHWFGRHRDGTKPSFAACLAAFDTLIAPLAAAGLAVVNCSRETALTAFPRVALEDAWK